MFYYFLFFIFFSLLILCGRNYSRLFGLFLFLLSFFFTGALALFYHKGLIHFQYLQVFSHLDF